MRLWEVIGHQLRSPSGWRGRLAGRVMEIINREPNDRSVAALELAPEATVLEIGCGPGVALAQMALAATNGLVIGLDASPEMLRQAARRNRSAIESGRVKLALGTFERLPFDSDSIDRVLAVNVAYFFSASEELSEVYRVLRPGGRLVIYATDRLTMSRWKFAGPGTHNLVDENSLTAALGAAGFDAQETEIRELALRFNVRGLLAVSNKPIQPMPRRDDELVVRPNSSRPS